MVFFKVASELTPVDARPALVERAVGRAVELNLAPVGLARSELHVRVRVVGVAVDRGHVARFGEILPEVLGDHLFDLVICHLAVEGVDQPVVRTVLASTARALSFVNAFDILFSIPFPPLVGSPQFVFVALAEIFCDVGSALFVGQLVIGRVYILWYVAGPHALVLAARGALTGYV